MNDDRDASCADRSVIFRRTSVPPHPLAGGDALQQPVAGRHGSRYRATGRHLPRTARGPASGTRLAGGHRSASGTAGRILLAGARPARPGVSRLGLDRDRGARSAGSRRTRAVRTTRRVSRRRSRARLRPDAPTALPAGLLPDGGGGLPASLDVSSHHHRWAIDSHRARGRLRHLRGIVPPRRAIAGRTAALLRISRMAAATG